MIKYVFVLVLVSNVIMHSTLACTLGKIDLRSIIPTTYLVRTLQENITATQESLSFTLSLCTATSGVLPSLTPCGQTGFILIHRGTSCNVSLSQLRTPLALSSTNPINESIMQFESTLGSAGDDANVTFVCNRNGAQGEATLVEPVRYSVFSVTNTTFRRRYNLTVMSYHACAADPLFCDETVVCSDRTKTCKNNVCVDNSCYTMKRVSNASYVPADLQTRFTVSDCSGTQVPLLSQSDFEVFLDGVSTTSSIFTGETTVIIKQVPASASVVVSTLLLDISGSMTTRDSAITFVRSTALSTAHYVGVYTFDGSANITLAVPYSTDIEAVVRAITAITSGIDVASTNLNGAFLLAVEEAMRMTSAFGVLGTDVVSSVVLITDGYDTAGRVARSVVAQQAATLRAKGLIFYAIATRSTNSDLTALTELTGTSSNVFTVSGTSPLAPNFFDIARKLSLQTNNTYIAAVCSPSRNGLHSVSIQLNSSIYTNVPSITWTFSSSSFQGGCSTQTLTSRIPTSVSTYTIPYVNSTTPLIRTGTALDVKDAYFFRFSNTQANLWSVYVTPSTAPVYVAYSSTTPATGSCLGSMYCSFASFTTIYNVGAIGTYTFMLTPKTALAATDVIKITVDRTTAVAPVASPTPSTTFVSIFTVSPTAIPQRNYYGSVDEKGMQAIIITLVVICFILALWVMGTFLSRTTHADIQAIQANEERLLADRLAQQEKEKSLSVMHTAPQPFRQTGGAPESMSTIKPSYVVNEQHAAYSHPRGVAPGGLVLSPRSSNYPLMTPRTRMYHSPHVMQTYY